MPGRSPAQDPSQELGNDVVVWVRRVLILPACLPVAPRVAEPVRQRPQVCQARYSGLGAQVLARPTGVLTVAFRVTDTGLGLSADRREAIFERFVQVSSDTVRQFEGNGWGL